MSKIFYSLCGEGRGHATRVHTIVEELRKRHHVVIYASGTAYTFLQPIYRKTEVEVRHIPGLQLHYNSMQKLKYLKTGYYWGLYLNVLPDLTAELAKAIEREKPDLAITDLEPVLPRAAERVGLPYISINHQHFLVVGDLSDMPADVRIHSRFLAQVIQWFYTRQEETIVSSFYRVPLRTDAVRVSGAVQNAPGRAAEMPPGSGRWDEAQGVELTDTGWAASVARLNRPALTVDACLH